MRRVDPIFLVLALGSTLLASSKNQEFSDFTTPLPLPPGSTLILGIVGGWERWDNPVRGVRRTALELRDLHLPGVYVETVENHKLDLARELIERAFPHDHGGARIVLYGQSLGGSAVVRFARELEGLEYPVLLTVQVDSIGKDDSVIPPNVRTAANFFQRDFLPVRGEPKIQAEDPARTRIIGNYQFHYRHKHIDTSQDAMVRRLFMGAHTKMEFDWDMWAQVKKLIVAAAQENAAR